VRAIQGAPGDLATTTLWDAFGRMKFDAVTVSSDDLPDVALLPAATKPAAVAANITEGGKPMLPPTVYKQVKLADGKKIRVAIIGVLGDPPYGNMPSPKNSPDTFPWKVSDPAAALAKEVPIARKKADLVVVLYGGIRTPGLELLKTVPDVDVMVIGREVGKEGTLEQVGQTWVVQNTDRGRYAGELGLTLDPKTKKITAAEQRLVPMDSTVRDDPEMAKVVQAYRQAQVVSTPRNVIQVASGKGEWAGSYACQTCHSQEFQQWFSTPHARAMTTLEKDDNGRSAKRRDCVVCHVVAFEKPGGYFVQEPWSDMKGVGCEACHGPSAAHVRARLRGEPDTARPVAKPGKEVCQTCHTETNDPDFASDADGKFLRIVHKEPPGGRPAPKPPTKPKSMSMSGASH
jgi:hypothetical protein